MEKIIRIDPQWEQKLKRHADKVIDLQRLVNELTENGLTVTFGDIRDLINNGTALYEQVEQTVKSNAGIFKLPAARKKFIEENVEVLQNVIVEAKKEINRILAVNSMNPMNIEAFDLKKGIVSISNDWVEQMKESHIIRATPAREKALELIHNVEEAIKELNDFVKDNKYFGNGVSTFSDTRRNLVWLSGNGDVNVNIDALEFI